MATEYRTIVARTGFADDFDEANMKQGEFAVASDTAQVWASPRNGEAVELARKSDLDNINVEGEPGVGIESVEQTITSTADNGVNVVTVTKTDGTTSTFEVRNGSRGRPGPQGEKGDVGTGIEILGAYDTVDELTAAHPTGTAGDAYLIGQDLYIWLENLQMWDNAGTIQGVPGADGKSAYQIAVDLGFEGTEAEWLGSLRGEDCNTDIVISDMENFTNNTLVVINRDELPDKIPQWYNGTAVTAEGVTEVSGSAAGDYYINTVTFDVFHATAPDTWERIGNIRGSNGSTGIFFGAYDGSDGQPPEDAVLWIDPNEAANADFITADGLVTAMSNADYSNIYSVNDTGGISVKIGPIRIETGYESMKCSTANSPVSKQVYFQHPFSLTPKIITHAALSDPKQGSCGRSDTNESGFALTFVRSSTTACGCNWFAIGLA